MPANGLSAYSPRLQACKTNLAKVASAGRSFAKSFASLSVCGLSASIPAGKNAFISQTQPNVCVWTKACTSHF